MAGKTLRHVRASRSDLSNWRLVDSSVTDLNILDSQITHWRAHNVQWEAVTIDHCVGEHGFYVNCSFKDLIARNSIFSNGHFVSCRFGQAQSELNSFGMCTFENTHWCGSTLSEVSFIGTVWHQCTFSDEDHYFVRFPRSLFIDTTFQNCSLRKSIFRQATFRRCHFENCCLAESVFHNACFIDTTFQDSNLGKAANLKGAQGLDL